MARPCFSQPVTSERERERVRACVLLQVAWMMFYYDCRCIQVKLNAITSDTGRGRLNEHRYTKRCFYGVSDKGLPSFITWCLNRGTHTCTNAVDPLTWMYRNTLVRDFWNRNEASLENLAVRSVDIILNRYFAFILFETHYHCASLSERERRVLHAYSKAHECFFLTVSLKCCSAFDQSHNGLRKKKQLLQTYLLALQ